MSHFYSYELWDGKRSLGVYSTMFPLKGMFLVIPEVSTFKQPYNRKLKEIKLPIIYRIVEDNGVDCLTRRVLDVRRKSKRQIEIIKKGYTL